MHGTIGGGPRREPEPRRGGGAALAARILLREALFGAALYALTGRDPRADALVLGAAWTALVLLTRRHGLLERRGGTGLLTECLVVFCGALAFRSLIALLAGRG